MAATQAVAILPLADPRREKLRLQRCLGAPVGGETLQRGTTAVYHEQPFLPGDEVAGTEAGGQRAFPHGVPAEVKAVQPRVAALELAAVMHLYQHVECE